MGENLNHLFSELSVMKQKDLAECNQELKNANNNAIVRKALMVYRTELLECLELYDRYLDVNA
jgi:hypothetical protein